MCARERERDTCTCMYSSVIPTNINFANLKGTNDGGMFTFTCHRSDYIQILITIIKHVHVHVHVSQIHLDHIELGERISISLSLSRSLSLSLFPSHSHSVSHSLFLSLSTLPPFPQDPSLLFSLFKLERHSAVCLCYEHVLHY